MAETVPVYNFISFCRVLYLRRWFILLLTAAAGVIAGGVSLSLPEVYRAHTTVQVAVPKYKATLTLLPKPPTVSVVRSMLEDPATMAEVIECMAGLNALANKNGPMPDGGALGDILKQMSDAERETVAAMDLEAIRAISPYALVRRLSAHTTITKETNLETEYSPLIDVYGTASTAAEAQTVTNLWLQVFQMRAERILRETIEKEALTVTRSSDDIEQKLKELALERTRYLSENQIHNLEAELASKRIMLYGVSEEAQESRTHRGTVNIEDPEETPFWNDRSAVSQSRSHHPVPNFQEALIPLLLSRKAVGTPDAAIEPLAKQVETLKKNIADEQRQLLAHHDHLDALSRKNAALVSEFERLKPSLYEARLLLEAAREGRVADMIVSTAQLPDRRHSPQRKEMVLAGLAIGFLLACGLCFLLDLWGEVIKPES